MREMDSRNVEDICPVLNNHKYEKKKKKEKKKRTDNVQLIRPSIPVSSTTKVRPRNFPRSKKSLCRVPITARRLKLCSGLDGLSEVLEGRDMAPRTGSLGLCEENAERAESEASVALFC